MAMSPSPLLSPTMGGSHLVDRQQSNSPPPTHAQQLSKRDKRRSVLANRLEELTKGFAENRDGNYRTQLQALQCDMNIIMEADPYTSKCLPDSREEIDTLIKANMSKIMKAFGPEPPQRAGKLYAEYAKEVNDAMEERDATLTEHERDFQTKKNTILSAQKFRICLAEHEHKALSSTVRDRLLNSVSAKKQRLNRDKDVLEIGESNAMMLHPSQFSISNPGSPGGIHGKRATRHRRDPEDLLNSTEPHRRKRKAHDSDESPAPKRLNTSAEWSTPSVLDRAALWQGQQSKQYLTKVQISSALYSVEKMFTEKELAMTYNNAALAAHAYMTRHTTDDLDSPPNGSSESSGENGKGPTADTENDDPPSPPPGMERQPSHATRSTRAPFSSNYMGMNVDLVTANGGLYTPPNIQAIARQMPKMPPLINLMGTRTFTRNDPVVTLSGLSDQEAAAELALIKRARAHNDEHGYGRNLDDDAGAKQLLKNASFPAAPYEHWIKTSRKPAAAQNTSSIRDELPEGQAPGLGGVEMAKENSFGGGSMGGTAMSRQATGESVKQSSRGRNVKSRAPF